MKGGLNEQQYGGMRGMSKRERSINREHNYWKEKEGRGIQFRGMKRLSLWEEREEKMLAKNETR